MIKFNCPYCRQNLEADEALQGSASTCPSCQRTIYVEQAPTPPTHAAETAASGGAKTRKKSSILKRVGLAVGTLVLMYVGLCILLWFVAGSRTYDYPNVSFVGRDFEVHEVQDALFITAKETPAVKVVVWPNAMAGVRGATFDEKVAALQSQAFPCSSKFAEGFTLVEAGTSDRPISVNGVDHKAYTWHLRDPVGRTVDGIFVPIGPHLVGGSLECMRTRSDNPEIQASNDTLHQMEMVSLIGNTMIICSEIRFKDR